MLRMLGLVLILVGSVGLVLGGLPYQRHENVEFGPLVVEHVERKSIPIPPLVAAAALLAGALLVARPGRSQTDGGDRARHSP